MLSTHSSSAGLYCEKLSRLRLTGCTLLPAAECEDAEAVKLMLAARRKSDHELNLTAALASMRFDPLVANDEKRLLHAPRAEGAGCVQSFEERPHLRLTVSAISAGEPAATTQRVPCSMLFKMNSASRRADR